MAMTFTDDLQRKKIGPHLAESLRKQGRPRAERLPVLIRLAGFQPPPRERRLSRTQHAERCHRAFDDVALPVRRLVERLGGTIKEPGAWLTGSLMAELRPDALPTLLQSEQVESVDFVRRILPEAVTR